MTAPLPFERITLSDLAPRAETARWWGGIYFLLLGLSFLLLPIGTIGNLIYPLWIPGASLFIAGLAFLWLAILSLPRRLLVGLSICFALPPLGITIAYSLIGSLSAAAILGFVTLSMVYAPFAPQGNPQRKQYRPDALGITLGAAAAATGFEFFLYPANASVLSAALGLSSRTISLVLLCTGCAVVGAQLLVNLPPPVRWIAHGLCGLALLSLQLTIAIAVNPLFWLLGAAGTFRGVTTVLLPWWSAQTRAFDRTAFRPRLALALMTAALLPIGVALPLVLATLPVETPELASAQQAAFGITVLLLFMSGALGWWFAGTFSVSLTRLVERVNHIAGGQSRDHIALPQKGVAEIIILSQALEQMAQALAARTEEQRLLFEATQQAHIQAEEAVRVRDAFLSVAAHELKNPLTSLLGHAQLLRRRAIQAGTYPEHALHSLEIITDQASRMRRMIDVLLDASRLQTGQLTISPARFDIVALVTQALDELAPTLVGHTLVRDVSVGSAVIVGDEIRIRQVLDNLLGNAVKYSPDGRVITVRMSQNDTQVSIAISDQGIGIPAAEVPKLFRQFYRAENTTLHGITGVGIGLYVVKEIVMLHGGHIEVDSQEQSGSTFTVSLPRVT